jgi:fructose-1,6-bisphosphatase II
MLYNGEQVGDGSGPEVDIAVDPVDGTTLTAKSLPNALAIVAAAERGSMFDPGPCVYMEKLAVAGDLADVVDFTAPVGGPRELRLVSPAGGPGYLPCAATAVIASAAASGSR